MHSCFKFLIFFSSYSSLDYGKSLNIQRVVPQDAVLYQTERYHTGTFGYEFPIKGDGNYVLVTKFSEVWFTAPNQKVGLCSEPKRLEHY